MQRGGESKLATAGAYFEPVELVPDELYVVGGNVPLDGAVSWAPVGARGFQAANCYLLLARDDDDEPLIVDPGLPYVEQAVVSGLQALVPDGAKPRVFLTRAQFDCVGNLGALAEVFSIEDVFTGGRANPFDSFETVMSADQRAAGVIVLRSPEESRLEVINTTVRILATFWAYDHATKTLFTSDSFTHATVQNAADGPVLDEQEPDETTLDDVRDYLFAMFWWLRYADTGPIVNELRSLFDQYDIEIIAPVRGRVLKGREVVARHVEMLITALEEVVLEPKWR